MKLENCIGCVYHLIHDEAEVSCYFSDEIVHVNIEKNDPACEEVPACPREKCGQAH